MGKFQYQCMAPGGEAMAGVIEADSPARAGQLLSAMGLKVYSLEAAPKEPARTRLGRNDFLLFNQQLAAITAAGLPLEKALRQTASDVQSGRLKRAINELATDLESGASLDEAFARHEKSFPYLYGRIIKAGVQTGRLSEMLTSLNRHLEIATATRKALFDALTYPAVVLILASVIFTGILAGLVPMFTEIFSGMRMELPDMTQALFWLSDHVWNAWLSVGGILAALLVARIALGASDAGRRLWERFLLHVPAIGRVYRHTHLARLADALAILVGGGCDLPTAVRLAGGASGSPNLVVECERLAKTVEAGGPLDADALNLRFIPAMMVYSMRVGSQRNDLEHSLYSLSEMYEQQARHLQGNIQSLLLPVLILVLGFVIGIIIMSLFLPMVSIIQCVQKS